MKSILTIAACACVLFAGSAAAASPKDASPAAKTTPAAAAATNDGTAPAGTQQSKMKTCNADAKGKKGDERKAFMKECLSK